MTLLIILGSASLFYLVWSALRLAVFALPLFVGLGIAALLIEQGFPPLASLMMGFVSALLFLWIARLIFIRANSRLVRGTFRGVFAVPAGIAGYYLIHGLAGLLLSEGIALGALSLIGALTTASSSLRMLEPPGP